MGKCVKSEHDRLLVFIQNAMDELVGREAEPDTIASDWCNGFGAYCRGRRCYLAVMSDDAQACQGG